jgi:hypothetical protein
VRATAPHMLMLIVYLVFAIGYLNVRDFTLTKLMNQSQPTGDYFPVFGSGMLKSADVSLSWAFNIPRAYSAQLPALDPFTLGYLKFFRALVFLLIAVVLIRSDRKSILFGAAWFWITLFPALPLIRHFLPYYLFLPGVGLSLIVGIVFAWSYDALSRIHTSIAAAIIVLTSETQNVFVFGVRNGHLIDETNHYRTSPHDFARFINSSSSYRPVR